MKRTSLLLGGLLTALAPTSALAADATVSLFDGKTLTGWTPMHDGKFSVRDGKLSLDGGVGWLRTEHRYRDFTLSLQWRALAGGSDSGLFFRSTSEGNPWPKRYQINLLHEQVGAIPGVEGAQGASADQVNPVGEWNRFRLTVAGKTATLELNERKLWQVSGIEQQSGWIGIQAENHRYEFRDLQLVELGYQDLLAGGLGAHLEVKHGGSWQIREGILESVQGRGGGWLGTRSDNWSDFILKLDYQVPPNGNSGVFLRCPLEGNPAYQGLEIQIIDDDATQWQLRGYQKSGAVYHAVAPARRVTRRAGTWESMEIIALGARIRVYLNGVGVVDADLDEHAEKIGTAPALKERPREGYIGLQNYGTGVRFRHLRLRRLKPGETDGRAHTEADTDAGADADADPDTEAGTDEDAARDRESHPDD